MTRSLAWPAAILLAVTAAAAPARAQDAAVDVELLLAVDVSGSMDAQEHAVQRNGYLSALTHPEFIAAISAGYNRRIALAYMEWAGTASQVVVVPWRLIDGPEAAAAFATDLAAAPIAPIRGTSISGALRFGMTLFPDNGFEGTRRIIDVSGDGPNRDRVPAPFFRDIAVASGFVINGLPIMIRPSASQVPLDRYYWECVTGGPGSFVIAVTDPDELAATIRRKLVLEVAGRAPPAEVIPVQAFGPVDCEQVERSAQPLYRPAP